MIRFHSRLLTLGLPAALLVPSLALSGLALSGCSGDDGDGSKKDSADSDHSTDPDGSPGDSPGTPGSAGASGDAGPSRLDEVEVVDPDATPETKAVFLRLRELAGEQMLFGMQHASTGGVFQLQEDGKIDWGADDGVKSDVKTLCSAGPAVYGFDVAGIVGDWWLNHDEEQRQKLMTKTRAKHVEHVKLIWERGGIVTFSWHAANPITNEGFRDGPRELWRVVPPERCPAIEEAFPKLEGCGSHWDELSPKFDMLAEHFANLKTDDGTPIPVIWRPWHENSGGWFWWGAKKDADEQYQMVFHALWSWMVDFFQERGIHNLLWSISPNGHGGWSPMDEDKYLAYTPGLELVDVLGYDFYTKDMNRYEDTTHGSAALDELTMVVELAEKHDKVAAFTEGGSPNGLADDYGCDFWSNSFIGPVLNDPVTSRLAYFLTWTNHPTSKASQWGPVPNHCSADDFASLCARDDFLLEGDVDWQLP